MLFNSFAYAIFLPIVFIAYWALPHRFRWMLLLAASYYFYMSWNVQYVVLILLTTVISYTAAIGIEKAATKRRKKACVAAMAIVSLGVLFLFKYFNFAMDSISAVARALAIPMEPIFPSGSRLTLKPNHNCNAPFRAGTHRAGRCFFIVQVVQPVFSPAAQWQSAR